MDKNERSSNPGLSQELECKGCGAMLKFKPGTTHLSCEYCGAENNIRTEEGPIVIEETNLEEYLLANLGKEETMEISTIICNSCGGETTLEPNITSDFCPFCDNPLVIKEGTRSIVYKPKYILPFNLDEKKALDTYRNWLSNLWFAPKDLKHYADSTEHFTGIYIPHWTYDCHTTTTYTGERGDDYTEQEYYFVSENSRQVQKSRDIVKTNWSHRSGSVTNFFDDILILASKSIPQEKMAKLRMWDLKNLVPYDDRYLSGFKTETYQVKIEDGYASAKKHMKSVIENTVSNDIGGHRQRIHQMNTQYSDATFKQILMPLWISAYRYNGKVYRFLINGRTGDIVGDRPYSTGKILLAILAGLIIISLISYFSGR